MADLRAIPQNSVLGTASEGLRKLRSGLDVVPLPEFLGGGLGQAMIGKAPEEVERWSYGESPFKTNPTHSPYIPEFKPERMQGIADTAMLPVVEALALGKLAGAGLRSGYNAVVDAAMHGGPNQFYQQSRREFMKQAGAVAGTAAAAGVVPPLLSRGLRALDSGVVRDVAKPAASVAAKAVARASPYEFYLMARRHDALGKNLADAIHAKYQPELLRAGGLDHAEFLRTPEGQLYQAQLEKHPRGYDELGPNGEPLDDLPSWDDITGTPRMDEVNAMLREELKPAMAKHKTEFEKKRADPKYEGYKTQDEIDNIRGNDKDGFLDAKSGGRAAMDEYLRSIGWKPNEEVEALIKVGGKYVDPKSGLHAVKNKHGELDWFSPRTGHSARHQHWVHDEPFFPEAYTYDARFPPELNHTSFKPPTYNQTLDPFGKPWASHPEVPQYAGTKKVGGKLDDLPF